MSHHLYKTEGLILKKRDCGEADRIITFFTKDFGKVEVLVQGVRYLKAKLRYSLSGLSFVRLGFVSTTKDYWRLVDAEEISVLESIRSKPAKSKAAFAALFSAERFIQGQEPDAGLWETIKSSFLFLETRDLSENDLRTFELLTACRLLGRLGYLENPERFEGMTLEEAAGHTVFLVSSAEKAISASQL